MTYTKTVWVTGDIVTQAKANNWETQYDCVFDSSAKTATGVWTFQTAVGGASADGLALVTTTPATLGNQKYSPRFRQRGFGFATGTSASMAVDFAQEVRPVQGSAAPTGMLVWSANINGAGYSDLLSMDSAGKVGVGTLAPVERLTVKGDAFSLRHATSNNIMGVLSQRGGGVDGGYLELRSVGVATVGLDSNGASYFNTGGNFGIGTASPTVTLDVRSANVGSATRVRSYNSDNTNTASSAIVGALVGGSAGGDPIFYSGITSVGNWNWGAANANSDKWTLSWDSSGSTPNGVQGTALLTISTSGDYTFSGTAGSATLSGSSRKTLQLNGNITGSDGNYADLVGANSSGNGGQISFRRVGANDATDMLFYTSATGGALTERMRITNDGNFLLRNGFRLGAGVGTTTYAMYADGAQTGINAPTTVTFSIGNSDVVAITASLIDMKISARITSDFYSTTNGTSTIGAGGRFKRAYLGGNTITSSAPVLDVEQTWNASGVSFVGATYTFFETASNAGSRYFQILGGASGTTDEFYVGKGGAVVINGSGSYYVGNTVLSGSALSFGSIPSTTGIVRLANDTYIKSRNQANSADFGIIGFNASNKVSIDGDGAGVVFGSGGVQLTTTGGKIQAITSTYFNSLDGSALTALSATALATGTVPTARLGSGSASSTTFLRGDQTWSTVGVKSIQKGTIDITNGNASNTATITAVDTSKAYVVFNGTTSLQSGDTTEEPGKWLGAVDLTNTTTVTAHRGASVANTLTVYFTVVEFF